MSDDYAKPGDTIEVTWDFADWKGRRYVVVECPESHKGTEHGDDPSNAWIIAYDDDAKPSYLMHHNYKIVARGNGRIVSCTDVDKSLRRQLNANLRGVFT